MRLGKFQAACAVAALFAFTDAAQAEPYTFTLIAETQYAVGAFGLLNHEPSLANSGTVAFFGGIFAQGCCDLVIGGAGMFTGNGNVQSNIISNGSGISIGGHPIINNSGQVGFFGNIDPISGFWRNTGGLAGTNTNLFRADSVGSVHGQPSLNDFGVGAAYGQFASNEGVPLEGIYTSTGLRVGILTQPYIGNFRDSPDINNSGHIAFAKVDDNGNLGMFLWNGSTIVQVVDVTTNGAGLATTSNADIQPPRINNVDHIVFHGRLATGYFGVFTEANGTVSPIALSGLSGVEYSGFGLTAAINDADEVAFLASVIDSGNGLYNFNGIFTGASPINDKVIQAGDSLFGATVLDVGFSSFGLNNNGQIAFWAQLDDGRQVIARADPVRDLPVLTLPGTIIANATSPAGAMVSYEVTATDNSGVAPTVVCQPATGSIFPIGTSTVGCSATNAAGNSSSGSFAVTVLGSSAQTTNLIAFIGGLGLRGGTANSLTSKLYDAVAALASGDVDAACSKLNAFINQASAQSGKQLTTDQAAQLIASANQIRAAQGCP